MLVCSPARAQKVTYSGEINASINMLDTAFFIDQMKIMADSFNVDADQATSWHARVFPLHIYHSARLRDTNHAILSISSFQ